MKCFYSYIKYNLKWLLLYVCFGATMMGILYLNKIPASEIRYGLLLCLVLLGLGIVPDFLRYRKRYAALRGLEASITVSMENLPETAEVLEAEYQNLVKILFRERAEKETETTRRERDMMEYCTMWVHQIKTPIAALRLLLQENSGDAEYAAERTEELQELFRIEQYVEMALQYMRLGSETTDFVLKEVELDRIIREAVHKYARQFISKKISLDYEAVNKRVVTDEKWLEFVIEQLLSNAIKYTQRGRIGIRAEERENAKICLVIEDTGIGIRAEDLPRVCEKGYTGYNGHADKRSTGIGLYLCSSILKKLNHMLQIESEEGVGTKVVIVFGGIETERKEKEK